MRQAISRPRVHGCRKGQVRAMTFWEDIESREQESEAWGKLSDAEQRAVVESDLKWIALCSAVMFAGGLMLAAWKW